MAESGQWLGDSSDVGKNISEFLMGLLDAADAEGSEGILEKLYADGASVRMIFREVLPPLAQQLVLRLAFGGKRPFQEALQTTTKRRACFQEL